MLANRLRKRARHLSRWARRASISCYRIYDRDIPELPLTVDWYEGRVYAAWFERKGEPPDLQAAGWREQLGDTVATALGVPPAEVYWRRRRRQRGSTQYARVAATGRRFTVSESGHRFYVNLSDYLDTGLFLDHRITRGLVAREARGGRFLNLFSYTGAFTVYAAAAGALASLSVDLSRRYTRWAEDNFDLNRLNRAHHTVVRADVLSFLEEARCQRERYDLAVVDPPTFSNSKKMRGNLDLQRDHVDLLAQVFALLTRSGIIFFSTNRRRFSIDECALSRIGVTAQEWTARSCPPDFRRRPHRLWRLVRG
jgi:23S rRNA G2069 N7-methylase RlmK/C1962 C5-methylase RlmI